MAHAKWIGLAVAVAAAAPARADQTQVTATAVAASSAASTHPHLGVMTGVGVPDGATAGLAWRPIRALRVEASAAHNYVSPGVRAGLTYIPFASWFTPTIAVGYGHFFERDANPAARQISGDATFSSPLLERVGYDYGDARVGFEMGRKHVTFYLHAGITRLTTQIHGVAEAAGAPSAGSMVTITTGDPRITLYAPSLDLGFVVYLF
jgi:hypothetical protein